MSESDILAYLTDRQSAMVETLRAWVNHDSPTFNKAAVDQMGQTIAAAFAETGAQIEVHPQPELGDHYTLSWTYPEAIGQILILGHFDTVWPDGEAIRRPFSIQDGRAMGPGVSDMKAGLLVACFAMEALQRLNLTPKRNVAFLLNSDEEIGSLSSRDLIEAEARKSDFCLVVEPARQGALTTWRKGVGRFVMKVRGLASHSGVDPEKGASAIEELARQIVTLHGFTNLDIGTTVNVGVISGGTRPNVIAADAEAEIDLRVMTMAEGERMVAAILGLEAQDPRTTVTIEGGMNRPPFEETSAGQVLAQKAQSIAEQLGFPTGTIGSGGGSDGNFASALGVPTLDGLGGVGAGSHALTEHTEIDFLPKRAALLAELILSL